MQVTFEIESQGEKDAGILPLYDQVIIDVDSGDPSGESGEFEQHILESLEEWYDGAKITKL